MLAGTQAPAGAFGIEFKESRVEHKTFNHETHEKHENDEEKTGGNQLTMHS